MKLENYITISKLCTQYQVTASFFIQIEEFDLIHIETIDETKYIALDTLHEVERMIRLYRDLNIHEENIGIVCDLIRKIEHLQQELKETRSLLHAYQKEEPE